MEEIAILPLSSPDAKPIKILEEKIVIGRGPFLQVTDKRVSRSHAVLEIKDGKLYLTPTHTNPCFFKKSSKAPVEIMKKDEKRLMYDNQIFGLLPDSLFFQVSCPAVQNGTDDKGSDKEETDEEVSESEEEEPEVKPKPKQPQKLKHQPSLGRKSLEKKDLVMPLDKKRKLPSWLIQISKNPPPGVQAARVAAPVKRPVAVSPPKPPKAPAKPKKTESEEDEDFDVEEEQRRQRTPAKRARKKYKEESEEEDWEAEEEYKPKKSTKRGGSAIKARKKARESSEEDWDSEDTPKKKRKKEKKKKKKQSVRVGRRRRHSSDEDGPSTSRPSRAARTKRASYVEDFVMSEEFSEEEDLPLGSLSKEEDSDFVMEEDDESGSDWEASQRSRGKGKSKGTPKRPSRRSGKRRSYADSDDDISEEEEYVPRSSRKRGASAKKVRRKKGGSSDDEQSEEDYKPKARGRSSPKKAKKQKDISESEEESEEEKPKKKAASRKDRKKASGSEEEEVSKEDKRNKIKKVKQLESKHRPPCMFGKKCYRKNPEHFSEFSHPGDQSFDEQSDLEDDDRPDCPYGPTCYRTNASHLKQYRHSKKVRENKTEGKKTKKGGNKDEEEDTGPNTYDYNDSFINDESQGKEESEDSGEEEGSEEGESSEEDISKLKKEAKQFMKNKKLTKAV